MEGSLNSNNIDTMMSAGTCVAMSPDETYALSGSTDGHIRVIDMAATYRMKLRQSSSVVKAIFSPDSQYVVSSGFKIIYVWALSDGALKFKIKKHDNFIQNIVFNEKGTHLISTALDKKIIMWDFRRGISVATFLAANDVEVIDFGPKGCVAYVADNCNPVAILHPNATLKKMLKGKYTVSYGQAVTNAQGVALSFSSQKVQANWNGSSACEIL